MYSDGIRFAGIKLASIVKADKNSPVILYQNINQEMCEPATPWTRTHNDKRQGKDVQSLT